MTLPSDHFYRRGESYPPAPEAIPSGLIQHGRYRVRFASSWQDVDTVLRLRYRVFNLELGEGLASSVSTGRDQDDFDRHCHHLLVEDESAGLVVGTYRMQTAAMAAAGAGFYSAGEFDLSNLPNTVVENAVEVGRACISAEHRNRQVLFLLWKGLARYMETNGKRYLFGCSSLPTQDEAEGARVLAHLTGRGKVHPEVKVPPLPELACDLSVIAAADDEVVQLPSLFRTYMRYGGWICGPPAVDREFCTIDFLVLFDVEQMEARSRNLFFE